MPPRSTMNAWRQHMECHVESLGPSRSVGSRDGVAFSGQCSGKPWRSHSESAGLSMKAPQTASGTEAQQEPITSSLDTAGQARVLVPSAGGLRPHNSFWNSLGRCVICTESGQAAHQQSGSAVVARDFWLWCLSHLASCPWNLSEATQEWQQRHADEL